MHFGIHRGQTQIQTQTKAQEPFEEECEDLIDGGGGWWGGRVSFSSSGCGDRNGSSVYVSGAKEF